jgi:hypothetical protein
MKKILLFLSFLAVILFFASCEKEQDKVTIKATLTPNTINALTSSSFVLDLAHAADTFQVFKWTNLDYGFNTVITYTVQVDKKTNNFSSPVTVVTVTNSLRAGITIGDINKILLGAGLDPALGTAVQFRIKAVINSNVAPVYSSIVEATVQPYQTVFPPIYMTGEATGGWGWTLYTYKELRSSSPNVYETIAHFNSTQTFRFFKQTDWSPVSYNYPYFSTVSTLLENALDGDLNFRVAATTTTGYYKITVNMGTKSVAMVSVPEPTMFMTGAALGGWDWTTNYVKMTWKSNGIFQATTDFAVETFRFFAQQDWGPISYNYPYFAGGTVSNMFINANDGDKNFKFVGTPGVYTITLNMLDLIITMTVK